MTIMSHMSITWHYMTYLLPNPGPWTALFRQFHFKIPNTATHTGIVLNGSNMKSNTHIRLFLMSDFSYAKLANTSSFLTSKVFTVHLCSLRQARWSAVFPSLSCMLAHSGSSVSSNETISYWSELAALCKAVCPSRGEVRRMISGGRG